MTNDLIGGIRDRVRYARLKLAYRLFPFNGAGVVANRIIWRCDTPKLDVSFVIRKKAEPDGCSREEMIGILDTFLGRKATPEEWNQILAWKANRP